MSKVLYYPLFKRFISLLAIGIFSLWSSQLYAQDTSRSILDINNSKIIKKANQFLDSNQKKINNFLNKKIQSAKDGLNKKTNDLIEKTGINEIDKVLPYERLLNKKYTLGRRAYQNTVSQFNYLFNADESLNEIIQKARDIHEDDFTDLLPFYDYDLSNTSKESIDSIIYRCNANIVLHDLRSNYVDDAYLTLAKAYIFHKNFDTAASILQFINYSFYDKEAGADLPIGSNLNKTGKFSIASLENERAWENKNIRNESMVWQARNYFEAGEFNEGFSLLQLLKTDAAFPKRLQPFLFEQLAFGYYQSGIYDSAANYLIKGLDNAPDLATKSRWTYLIAQLFEREQQIDKAYLWYKKASSTSTNPMIAIYANIYMASIEANRGEKSWETLANSLERMLKKDKYLPFADIVYFEMAQLAIRNQASSNANKWLIASIQKNDKNYKLKQKALIQLGDINYRENDFAVAKIAYDQINNLLKSYPNYEQITLRKKWIDQISNYDAEISKEDSLQKIYLAPKKDQVKIALNWQKRTEEIEKKNKNLLSYPNKITESEKNVAVDKNNNNGYSFNNAFGNNTSSKQNVKSDFYFDNPQTVSLGSANFINKWGNRPNVDNWRRKTTIQLIKSTTLNTSIASDNQTIIATQVDNLKKGNTANKETADLLKIQLIQSDTALKQSKEIWNKQTLAIAKTFLYELNDFEKAFPRYQKVIQKNIDPSTTESAMLDLASHYIHIGQPEKSDSIINIIKSQFPEGSYVNKKKAKENIERIDNNTTEAYKENYFLAQIGDWDQFNTKREDSQKQFKGTKWQTPYNFLQVKMYAQNGLDSNAIVLLNEIVAQNKSEIIKSRARAIINEINHRKETEAYLKALKIIKPQKNIISVEKASPDNDTNLQVKNTTLENKESKKEQALNKAQNTGLMQGNEPQIEFTNDSLEQHYIALQTFNVSPVFVKETQNALKDVHAEEFRKQNLAVTYVQFSEQSYIVWIGPFANSTEGFQYLQKVKPRLNTEIISFIAKKQYDLTLIGKSNIIQINNQVHLDQYKRDKSKYYFKP
jgi:hypothetical protein